MARQRIPTTALIYNFDGTLSPINIGTPCNLLIEKR